jgi:hypothetical protein
MDSAVRPWLCSEYRIEGSLGLASMSDVTRTLAAIEQGDAQASEQLLPLVYEELRRLAAQKMAQEKPGQTLDATALVHEAYLRLVGRTAESAMGFSRPLLSQPQPKPCDESWSNRRVERCASNSEGDESECRSMIVTRRSTRLMKSTSPLWTRSFRVWRPRRRPKKARAGLMRGGPFALGPGGTDRRRARVAS